ncbi:MFS general substrate transporter [Cryphonectria parasitica EP155]|uniref:MFS general substrate transporter n=1 Tax=Cryphonectria parasitica (strain ATCC 38755 / EP155) TaxID=660469 RepID=A0A9P5CHZ2_CRYP1|nr:MFS general substrate transporter [Cryphonectria parasitica EP155]KAF3760414.1 MFS general substrate transporter [Cryphonectria parasitica EP155]
MDRSVAEAPEAAITQPTAASRSPIEGESGAEDSLDRETKAETGENGRDTEKIDSSRDGSIESAEEEYVTGMKLIVIVASLTLTLFLVILDTSIISTAVPQITDEFHSLQDVGWYASAYQLASASIQPLSGKMYQKFHTKSVFIGFVALFELGSLLCGVATSSKMLIVGRAVAGMGTAGIFNGGLGIVMACAPLHRRPSLIGMMIGISQVGMMTGPLIGGALTEYTTWRWCFYINLPAGGLGLLCLIFITVPEEQTKSRKPVLQALMTIHRDLDLVGFALMAPAIIQLLLALEYGGEQYPWSSPTVIGLFVGAGATAAVWMLWNWWLGDRALVPLSVLRLRIVWAAAMTQMGLSTALLCSSYYLPIYFQAVRGVSPLMSGVYLLPNILGQVLGVMVSGFLVQKTGFVIPYSLFSTSVTATATGLFAIFSPTTSTGIWVGLQLLAGVARGCGLQMGMLAVQAILGPAEIAIGISLLMSAEFTGLSILLIVADTIFNQSIESQLVQHAPDVDASAVVAAGATGFRSIIASKDIPGVLLAYSNSVDRTFYVPAAVTAVSFITANFMGWTDLRKKQTPGLGTGAA